MTHRHDIRRYIARDGRVVGNKRMRANLAKLMDPGESGENHPVVDLDMSGKRREIGEHAVATDDAVMRNMRGRHEEIVITHRRDALVFRRATIDRHIFAKDVAVTDAHARRLTSVFFVLRRIAYPGKLKQTVVGTERSPTGNDNMRSNDASRANLDIGADDGERPHLDIVGNFRPGCDHRARVDTRAH